MTGGYLGGIPVSLDLRQLCGAVRDQGARQSCLACSTSDAHAVGQGLMQALSAEYLFFHAAQRMPGRSAKGGLSFSAAGHALHHDGQPEEAQWPYQVDEPVLWQPPPVAQLWHGRFESVALDHSAIVDALHEGKPVILGLKLVPGFRRVQDSPHVVDPSGSPAGGHAVVAVGVGRRPGATDDDLLMIRNSWGSAWGSEGHAWLPREYLDDKLLECSVVAAVKAQ